MDLGFELGGHTVNHVDVGECAEQEAQVEILRCRDALRAIIGKAVAFFSFPFGKARNISSAATRPIASSGHMALFAADGGVVSSSDSDPYSIPRLGGSGEWSTLHLLLQIEGVALSQIAAALLKRSRTESSSAKRPRAPAATWAGVKPDQAAAGFRFEPAGGRAAFRDRDDRRDVTVLYRARQKNLGQNPSF